MGSEMCIRDSGWAAQWARALPSGVAWADLDDTDDEREHGEAAVARSPQPSPLRSRLALALAEDDAHAGARDSPPRRRSAPPPPINLAAVGGGSHADEAGGWRAKPCAARLRSAELPRPEAQPS